MYQYKAHIKAELHIKLHDKAHIKAGLHIKLHDKLHIKVLFKKLYISSDFPKYISRYISRNGYISSYVPNHKSRVKSRNKFVSYISNRRSNSMSDDMTRVA